MEQATEEYDGMFDVRLARSFQHDVKVIVGFVSCLTEARGNIDGGSVKKTQALIELYQEQGQLLEPYLERILGPLMATLQYRVMAAGNAAAVDLQVVKRICSVVHTLMTVCGHKTVVKFLPHQACDLEVTVALLERCHQEVTGTSILKEESTGDWETQCTLLLWLSILVLIPFDMASVDTALADSDARNENSPKAIPPLVERMIKICKEYLASPGPVREMAGLLLSHLLCRPDMDTALTQFISWTRETIHTTEDIGESVFLVPGIVGVLAAIFKVGRRDTLLATTPEVWDAATHLVNSLSATRSSLLRKLLVKLIQRVGLVHLPPSIASWRYMQINRSLAQSLPAPSLEGGSDIVYGRSGNEMQKPQGTLNLQEFAKSTQEFTQDVMEENTDVPDIVEEVIEQLLSGLRDKVTVVRWSAAKGVGRVTGRLSLTLADEVVASVLDLFLRTEGDGAWHGGCLALAELARRGLLLPERLSTVVPVVVEALHYDVQRGPHSVGSHVRDAAAYVTWAFARAYSPALMKDHLPQIAPALLSIACYDREVNCRRAAAAAFQEIVGRQGDFEHGIDIVTAADYFSLGGRSNAYQVVAVYIAQFDAYRLPLITEILNSKVSHWEKALRELAAEALSLLVKYDAPYFEGPVLDTLLPWTLSTDLGHRHGATLAIAEVIRALHSCGFQLTREKEQAIGGIVPAIEKARLYRGKGGEIMRAAVSRLIDCTAAVRVPLHLKVQRVLLESIDDNLKHPNADIQACAVAAFSSFVQVYMLPVTTSAVARTTSKYLQILKVSSNPAAQRGAALALGALPFDLLCPMWRDVIDTLCSTTSLKGKPAEEDAETRVNAVHGLTIVCETICSAASVSRSESAGSILVVRRQVMSAFFKALDDYAVDNRGDVGSWIREAAMEGIERCTYILCQPRTSIHQSLSDKEQGASTAIVRSGLDPVFNDALGAQVIGGLAKQAAEKIDRVRDIAGRTLQRLLHNPQIPCMPHKEEMKQIIEDDPVFNWAVPKDSFPLLVQLLRFPEYRTFLLSGLVISIGGLADSLGKASGNALVDFLRGTRALEPEKSGERSGQVDSLELPSADWLGEELLQILKDNVGVDRVVVPVFKTLDILFNRGIFSRSQPLENQIAAKVSDCVQLELCGCKDVAKLLAGASILSHLASLAGLSQCQSVLQLLNLLYHRYPTVRKFCSEQLYLLLLQIGEEVVDQDSVETALELIGEICWDGPLEGITANREHLYSLFHLQVPSDNSLAFKQPKLGQMKRLAASDENETYASLVDSAGY